MTSFKAIRRQPEGRPQEPQCSRSSLTPKAIQPLPSTNSMASHPFPTRPRRLLLPASVAADGTACAQNASHRVGQEELAGSTPCADAQSGQNERAEAVKAGNAEHV